jgi:outer membrane protein OmpA-like peptidoglycan-associated protein
MRIEGLLSLVGGMVCASLALDAAAAGGGKITCRQMADGFQQVADRTINRLASALAFTVTKKLVGQNGKIKLTWVFNQGELKASVDTFLGADSWSTKVPSTKPSDLEFEVGCPIDCPALINARVSHDKLGNAPVLKLIAEHFAREVIKKLPPTLRFGDVRIGIDWPKVTVAPEPSSVKVTLSDWRINSAEYKKYKVAFPKRLKFASVSGTLRCPATPIEKKDPPKNEPPTDTELTCGTELPVQILFDSDKHEINRNLSGNGAKLDELVELVKKIPASDCAVRVVGHTDCQGAYDYNLNLSRNRAESVMGFLRQRVGGALRLRSEGKAWTDPAEATCAEYPKVPMNADCNKKGPRSTDPCLSKNRRTELITVPIPGRG